ncbi:MAG TPA: zinc ribbon domain-containing protein, partial [Acidobacteria bacterium]|nr:zinc ribbon domain-containing protein [Acidobacteriota bacterium]
RLVPTLLDALQRPDPRWLLPAWATMMPDSGLDGADFEDPSLLDVLTRRGFLVPEDPAAAGGALLFGPPTVEMGTELMLSWSGCCGFQAMVVRQDHLETASSAFFVTTGVTHHMFLRSDQEHGEPLVAHQTLSRSELDTFMARTMARLLAALETTKPPEAGQPTTPLPVASRCPSCGATVPDGARFCGRCGQPLG